MRPKSNHLITSETTAFLVDRQSRHLTPATLRYYETELRWFSQYLDAQRIRTLEDLTPQLIRQYLIHLQSTRNANGIDASYRAIKAFLSWWSIELDDPAYKNPILKVARPKTSKEPIPGIPLDQVKLLLAVCPRSTNTGQRDRAIFITLLDTGLRKEELVALDIQDLNQRTGALQVRHGKGDKNRTVYTGPRARTEIIRYLRTRTETLPTAPLFLNQSGTRLTGAGLRQILRRRSEQARLPLPHPSLHDFRRTFAIESLRNGIDTVTLMHLMGHTSVTILQRYLKLIERDLQQGHARSSPADKL
jgi:site-specific recombinase XerD